MRQSRKILGGVFLGFLASWGWASPHQDKNFPLTTFNGGLNSNYSSLTIADNEAQDALNVYFDKDNSVQKRKGYTLYGSTAAVSFAGMWSYVDSSNTYWLIVRSSDSIRASNGSGSFTVKVATVPLVTTSRVSAVSAFGKIYFVDSSQGVYSWDGSSVAYISGSPKGTLITEFHGRLWVSGLGVPNQNYLYGSAYLDGSTWTAGTLATDPVLFQVGLNDRSDGVTAFWSGYNDTLYLFKNLSIQSLTGFDQTDFTIRVLSREAGCVDPGSLQAYKGYLYFISQRGLEQFDGAFPVRISNKIKNLVDPLTKSTFNSRSWVQTGNSAWTAGTINPAGTLTTTISSGNLTLSTQTAQAAFSDTAQADFQAGTLTNLDATTTPGALTLSLGSASSQKNILDPTTNSSDLRNCSGTYEQAQSFTVTPNFVLTAFSLQLNQIGTPINPTIILLSDNAGVPGSVIQSFAFSSGANQGAPGSSAYSEYKFTLTSPLSLTAGTTYWMQMTMGSPCTTNVLAWHNSPSLGTSLGCNGSACSTLNTLGYRLYGKTYSGTGNIVSQAFDMTFATSTWVWNWGNLAATFSVPNANTSVSFQTQTSSNSSNWEALSSASTGAVIPSTVQRYIRYKANFTGLNGDTPTLNDVTLNSGYLTKPTGSLKSQAFNIGSAINSFTSFQPTQDVTTGGAIAYSLCTSNNSAMTGASCAAATANSQITTATNTWVQVFSTFTVTAGAQQPTLSAFTVNWNEGTPRPFMSSVVYDDRYWLAGATNTADAANDGVIVMYLNQGNPIFTRFDIKAGALALFRGSLYHGDSAATGNVYLDDIGYNDNGTAINAYVTTKDYAPSGVTQDKYFESLYVIADALGNYNLATQYTIDRNPNLVFSLSSITQNEQTGMINLNLPFPFDTTHQDFGRTISFKFSNSTVDQAFNLYGGTLVYKERNSLGNLNAQ